METTAITPGLLSVRGDRAIRMLAGFMLAVVAGSSAVLSWHGLVHLAVISGIPGSVAFLLPLAIDGCLMLGAVETIHATLTRRTASYGWLLTAVGVSLSVLGNVVSAAPNGFLPALVHGVAPSILFLSTEALVRIVKHQIVETQAVQAKEERKARRQEAVARPKARAKADPEELLASYAAVIESMPAEASKASMVEAILLAFPDARNKDIAATLGVEIKTVGTTIQRVRDRLRDGVVLSIAQ